MQMLAADGLGNIHDAAQPLRQMLQRIKPLLLFYCPYAGTMNIMHMPLSLQAVRYAEAAAD